MTQAPGSCDKPPAHDNKQSQTNPETLPGLARLQAARSRQGAGCGGDGWDAGTLRHPPAQLLPRHPAECQREDTATSVPPGSALAWGCFSRGDAGGRDLHPDPISVPPARPAPSATGSPGVPWPCPRWQSTGPTRHTSVP